ncbi:MAG: hypothetical protein FWF15_07835 [Oscillospiraceae bacterium]|nr:hypothetical protein [Oscillospiraceae bacterium]
MKSVFKNEKGFRIKFEDYLSQCKNENCKKLPNIAGFCAYCKITRAEFLKLGKYFPTQYDIMMSTFTDEAVNTKSPNTGATIEYLKNLIDMNQNADILCGHNFHEDGA